MHFPISANGQRGIITRAATCYELRHGIEIYFAGSASCAARCGKLQTNSNADTRADGNADTRADGKRTYMGT
ncbi:MAG TPA: hypothetical protein V6D17_03335 [Candidatus Obscuribacterales bacterium]